MSISNRGNNSQKVTIANGATKSGVVDLRGMSLTGLIFPVTPTGTTFTFEGSIDGVNFYPIKDSANDAISVSVNGANLHTLNPIYFLGVTFIKLVSSSAEGAARDIWCISGNYTDG